MEISGTYPMLYAFFDEADRLRREAVARQVEAAIASGASGIAVLGLGTEVHKLGRDERRSLVEWTIADVAGRKPVAVTLADGNATDMIESARFARDVGASWLILQPPRPPASSADLLAFFGAAADSVDCPVGIQNAPEFLGIGLSAADLAELNRRHKNVVLVKAETTAVGVGRVVDELNGKIRVFNGRAGLELTDNYRAGVDGMIPGIETIDLQVAIERAMRAGKEDEAENLYRLLLPTVCFIMQTLSHFLVYGKLVAALRLGIAPSATRAPSDIATPLGESWARRFAADLGPLPA
ncbi:MAG TPA: dihydrodipicolinate synthase family protein [Devosia sp.]|nr:dihydrodipicolinate synthase family protein [Devosia sp.]